MIREEEVYRIGRLGKTHGVRGEISFLFDDDVFDRVDADFLACSSIFFNHSSGKGTGKYKISLKEGLLFSLTVLVL